MTDSALLQAHCLFKATPHNSKRAIPHSERAVLPFTLLGIRSGYACCQAISAERFTPNLSRNSIPQNITADTGRTVIAFP